MFCRCVGLYQEKSKISRTGEVSFGLSGFVNHNRSFHAGARFYLMIAADRAIILLRVIISTQVFAIMIAKGGMIHGKDPVGGR